MAQFNKLRTTVRKWFKSLVQGSVRLKGSLEKRLEALKKLDAGAKFDFGKDEGKLKKIGAKLFVGTAVSGDVAKDVAALLDLHKDTQDKFPGYVEGQANDINDMIAVINKSGDSLAEGKEGDKKYELLGQSYEAFLKGYYGASFPVGKEGTTALIGGRQLIVKAGVAPESAAAAFVKSGALAKLETIARVTKVEVKVDKAPEFNLTVGDAIKILEDLIKALGEVDKLESGYFENKKLAKPSEDLAKIKSEVPEVVKVTKGLATMMLQLESTNNNFVTSMNGAVVATAQGVGMLLAAGTTGEKKPEDKGKGEGEE